jgi:hypothetical protein
MARGDKGSGLAARFTECLKAVEREMLALAKREARNTP